MDRDDHEAKFQEDRRRAVKAGCDEYQKHVAQYPGVYNYSGPWKDDPCLKK